VRSGVYAITLDEIGKATLRSSWPIARYHREFVVTPTERLQMPAGYRVVDSGWDMSTVTTRTPWGVTSRSKLEGSVFWMEIAKECVLAERCLSLGELKRCLLARNLTVIRTSPFRTGILRCVSGEARWVGTLRRFTERLPITCRKKKQR